jgi:hypothetical protein
MSRGIEGAFFPSAKPILEREILDVNKTHFILASTSDASVIVEELKQAFLTYNLAHVVGKSYESLWTELAKPNRFDTGDAVFAKRILQHALPTIWRERIANELFAKYVSTDAHAFADDLYMSPSQLSEMVQAGMYVGGHGYRHLWLGKEDRATQMDEVQRSLEFLKGIGAPTNDWVMCYPYGDYNQITLDILKANRCLAGLTTKVEVANFQSSAFLELSRLDTNDLPQ